MISPVKAIIFDADGVLLDSLSIWRELGKRYITDLGYHPIAGMEEILFPMSMEQGAAWLRGAFRNALLSASWISLIFSLHLQNQVPENFFNILLARKSRLWWQLQAQKNISAGH